MVAPATLGFVARSLVAAYAAAGMAANIHEAKLTMLSALELKDLWGIVGDHLAQQGLLEKDILDWPAKLSTASGLQKGRMWWLANQTAWSEQGVDSAPAFKHQDDSFWEGPSLMLVEAIAAGLEAAGAQKAPCSV